jgi:hypothetical protein
MGYVKPFNMLEHSQIQQSNQQEIQSNLASSETIRREHFGKKQSSAGLKKLESIFEGNSGVFLYSNRHFFANNLFNFVLKILFFASKSFLSLFFFQMLRYSPLDRKQRLFLFECTTCIQCLHTLI